MKKLLLIPFSLVFAEDLVYSETPASQVQTAQVQEQVQTPKVKTAAEQGFFKAQEDQKAQYEAKKEAEMSSYRQRGLRYYEPNNETKFAIKDRALVNKWVLKLTSVGFSSDKVYFEAKNQNPADFENWASDMYDKYKK